MRFSLFGIIAGTICIALVGMVIPAKATMVDVGGGALYDDLSGLYIYSDPSEFCDMTYAEQVAHVNMLNSTISSSPLHGPWRLATQQDHRDFSPNYWLNPGEVTKMTPTQTSYDPVHEELRYEYYMRLDWQDGIYTDRHFFILEVFVKIPDAAWREDHFDRVDVDDSYFESYIGAFVVADPVPIPGTLILLGTALSGFAGIRIRKKRKRRLVNGRNH